MAVADCGYNDVASHNFNNIFFNDNPMKYSALIISGDLSYANGDQIIWDKWFQMIQPLVSNIPIIPAPGNHEQYDYFSGYLHRVWPHKKWYSAKVGYIYVLSLSSEESGYQSYTSQYKWLENELKSIDKNKYPWIIAAFHRPWYCSNKAHYGSGDNMKSSFESLFEQYHVDIVLAGHIHAYERTSKINGIIHLTIGTGGTDEGQYDEWYYPEPDDSIIRNKELGYHSFNVYNKTHIEGTFMSINNEIIDHYWITK